MSISDEIAPLCAAIAARWEPRPERIANVTEQVRAIHDKLIEWGWGTVDTDELDYATIMYSRACAVHECCEWLPFDLMPAWEDDLYCLLMDEERWLAHINSNGDASDLVELLRNENQQRRQPL